MIFVLGHFAEKGVKDIGGQHVRTSSVYELIVNQNAGEIVRKIDISKSKIFAIIFLLTSRSGRILLLPGRRFIMFAALILLLRPSLAKRTTIVAIGGWLPNLVIESPWIKRGLKTVNSILVQLPSMASSLLKEKLNNVRVLPNFRVNTGFIDHKRSLRPEGLRFVFLSRVCPQKGVITAIESVLSRDDNSILDIYGPIQDGFVNEFQEIVSSSDRVFYKGVVDRTESIQVLSSYDVFLFPSTYPGEGFPGALLEAAYAGLYCVASDHLYNREVIENYCRGETCTIGGFKEHVSSLTASNIGLECHRSSLPDYKDLENNFAFFS